MKIQDNYLPDYHFNEVHSIRINSSPTSVRALVEKLDFSGSLLIRILFALRGMPKRMMNMEGLEKVGRFIRLELTDNDMLLGLIGQFWKPSGNLQHVEPSRFTAFNEPGFLKAVWSFNLIPGDGFCTLETETRIQCLDEYARRKFRPYWFIVRPFSGLIRLELLRTIRRQADQESRRTR